MATISLDVPDANLPELTTAFATLYGYDVSKDGTKAAFAKKQLALFAKRTLADYREQTAVATARQQVAVAIEAVNIT